MLVDTPEAEGAWAKLAAQARSWPGRALITCELFGFSEPDQIPRIADSLAPAASTSLDATDVELLRAVTARTAGWLDRPAQRGLINERLLPVLRRLDRPRRPLRLPASFQPLMSEVAARDMEAIAAAGCHVHGDLDELLPGSEAFADEQDARHQVPQDDIMNAAIDALVTMAQAQPPAVKGT